MHANVPHFPSRSLHSAPQRRFVTCDLLPHNIAHLASSIAIVGIIYCGKLGSVRENSITRMAPHCFISIVSPTLFMVMNTLTFVLRLARAYMKSLGSALPSSTTTSTLSVKMEAEVCDNSFAYKYKRDVQCYRRHALVFHTPSRQQVRGLGPSFILVVNLQVCTTLGICFLATRFFLLRYFTHTNCKDRK